MEDVNKFKKTLKTMLFDGYDELKTLVNICSRTKDEQAQLYRDASSTEMRSTNVLFVPLLLSLAKYRR